MLISATIHLVERVFYRNPHQFSSLDEEVFVDIAILSLSQSSILETLVTSSNPVLNINDRATGGRRTKDILGGPKGWGPKKKVANIEIYVIFEVFAFCGRRTKTDFKDRVRSIKWY